MTWLQRGAERIRANAKARIGRDAYRRILDGLSVAVLALDQRLRILLMNPAAEALLAVSACQARQLLLSDLLLGAERFIAELRHCLDTGTGDGLAEPTK